MKFSLERLSQISLVFMASCLVIFILYTFSSFLRPFIFAIIITILAVPCTLNRKKKNAHWSVLAFKWAGALLLLLLVASVVNLFLQDNVEELGSKDVDAGFSEKILEYELDFFGNGFRVSDFVNEEKLGGLFASSFDVVLEMVQGFFSQILIIFIFLIFTIPSYKKFLRETSERLRGGTRRKFLESINTIERKMRDYILIKSQVSLLTGALTAGVLYLFGVEYAILFGFLTFILNYIPNIGSFVAVGVVAIFEVLLGDLGLAGWIFLIVILSLIQFVIGSIIEPKLAGDKLSISPILILLSLFFWGWIWGIWGMFFSVPLTIFVIVIFEGLGFHRFVGLD